MLIVLSLPGSYVFLAWHAPAVWKHASQSDSEIESGLAMWTFRAIAPLYESITEHRWERLTKRDRILREELRFAIRQDSSDVDEMRTRWEANRREMERVKIGYLGCMKVHKAPIQGRLKLNE